MIGGFSPNKATISSFHVKAFVAHSTIIELYIVNPSLPYISNLRERRSLCVKKVEHLAAPLAEEMDMGREISVVADTVVIDCYHLSGVVLGEQTQSVVKGCARKSHYPRL